MLDMFDAFLKCIDALDLTVIEKMQLPARSERVEQLPRQYLDGRVGHWLGSNQFSPMALFGRRTPERVARSSLPASENLHKNGLMHCSKLYARLAGNDECMTRAAV
jgi:hypothetical protein